MDVFPSIHNDDIGIKPVGYVYSQPVFLYYPESSEARESAWRKHLISIRKEKEND